MSKTLGAVKIVATAILLAVGICAPRCLGDQSPTVNVFSPKTDGYTSIRIPALVVTKSGALLAFAEGRSADADQAQNKIIGKRSDDGGATWSQVSLIADDGRRALNNPCAVVDRSNGRVLLMVQSYPADVGERSGEIETGYEGDKVVRNLLLTSDDHGLTWSPPRDITRQTKRPERVTTIAGGPGIGIQISQGNHAGRIVFPFNEGPFGLWNIYAVYSDDHGATWQMGEPAPGGLVTTADGKPISQVNEAQIVELGDGSLRFIVRRWAGRSVRRTSISRDGGGTWSAVDTLDDLPDPGCQGSVLRYEQPADSDDAAKTVLLYSGPDSRQRANGTIFLSRDDGQTWPVKRVLCPGAFAYSCLAALPDGGIGCLFEAEGTKKIVFARFDLPWLEAAAPTDSKPSSSP